MAVFKPFKAIRPCSDHVKAVASRPYDVLDTDEARVESSGNHLSFLHIVKPEIDLPKDTNPYSNEVYEKGKENFNNLRSSGVFIQDDNASFYIYRLTMEGRSQIGLVGCCFFEEYFEGIIKKHELTRIAKENDRVSHVECLNANAEPVFFSYRGKDSIDDLVSERIKTEPIYNFHADDGIQHELWLVSSSEDISIVEEAFKSVPYLYVADGHHRTAAAARIGQKRKEENLNHTGLEEYNYFLAVLFPEDQLKIFDYNRVVKDLNGLSSQDFLNRLEEAFIVSKIEKSESQPRSIREFCLYMEGGWYRLLAKEGSWDTNDPVADLDVTILSDQVLTPLLNITDLRKDNRIDFVGGIRGLEELEKRVDSGEMKAAFALYPVSMDQLLKIADAGEIMPPKTTWFEPKLRSGLFIHDLE
ncbi:MAG: DUF1015 domain-containing protein [Opitutae bacterium]|jgi:uncharacterized protein (DUF1015 family)|nr:DUF1015 domain-containing protein [Opitutae bacterium]